MQQVFQVEDLYQVEIGNVEKLVFKLISQLKKRDEKIAKLEKKLKISMQYLEGALELEVSRQDAEITAVDVASELALDSTI